MSSATLTLLGFYQHCNRIGKNFFDKLDLNEAIDKDLLITEILHEAGDFEVLYTDPDMMCDAVELFSAKWKRTIDKWVEVEAIEYEPLDNYDRKEAWSDSFSESIAHSLSSSESTSTSSYTSESQSTSVHTSDSTSNSMLTDNDISAFNANTLQNDTSSAVNAITAGQGTNDSRSQVLNNTDSKEQTMNQLLSKDDKKNKLDHRGRVHGNIGVMTTQAIYTEQWNLVKDLNIYEQIYILFAREFTIPFSY